jgi:hypothetical protein
MKTAAVANQNPDAELAIKGEHFVHMQTIELLHRRFLDVVTAELGRRESPRSFRNCSTITPDRLPMSASGRILSLWRA